MLIYESEGFCEVDDDSVLELHRSTDTVTVTADHGESFELQALVCRHRVDEGERCHVGFFCRNLKRALVFAARASSGKKMVQTGLDALQVLGVPTEPVRLNLSPAMRQVVLRDIPGLLTPEQARKANAEKREMLAQLQKVLDEEGPESPAGKRAALKLNAEQRLDEKAATLRELLCERFAPAVDEGRDDLQALSGQIEDLTGRLNKAEALYRDERAQRELLEGIMAAAEKRIQELEEVLVDAETITADSLKQKQKMVSLQGQVRALTDDLAAANGEVERQRGQYDELAAEIKTAQARIASLEKELADATEIAAGVVDTEDLLRQAEERVAALQAELVETTRRLDVELSANEELRQQQLRLEAQLEAVQRASDKAEQRAAALAADRSGDGERITALQKELDAAVARRAAWDKERADLQSQLNTLDSKAASTADSSEEVSALREALQQERLIRQRLEKGAVADQKRIEALEAELGGSSSGLVLTAGGKGALAAQEVELIKAELKDALARAADDAELRAELEGELEEAHRMIATLEQALKESRATAARPVPPEQGGDSAEATDGEVRQLTAKLAAVQAELERERRVKEGAVSAQTVVEQRLNDLEARLMLAVQSQAGPAPPPVAASPAGDDASNAAKTKPAKQLPHELRPPPKKGARFHPDWDLEGVPCRSVEEILQAWASVYNVQLSLEGYPAQYCSAFLIVLKKGKQKQLFLLFNLKKDRHVLVCVPAAQPVSDAELNKAVEEGKRYLQLSGFEIEPVDKNDLAGVLASYVLGE